MASPRSIAILGAGHAGGRCAAALRRRGYDGDLTLFGAEPELPHERPPLSKGLLRGEKGIEDCHLNPEGFYRDQAIALELGAEIERIDARELTITHGATERRFDRLVLATGGHPRSLPLPGAGLAGVHLLRSVQDARAIAAGLGPGAKLVVVGGGFIGLEVAASARSLGVEVTLLEAADRLIGRACPAVVAHALAALHRDQGVGLRLGAQLDRFLGMERLEAVALTSGERIPATLAVVGVGIYPAVALAAEAGLGCDDGVSAGPDCLTDAHGIAVIGDAASAFNVRYGRRIRLESWQNAEQQAEIAAAALLGEASRWDSVPWLWSDQYDWNLQVSGFPNLGDRFVSRGRLEDGRLMVFALRDGLLVGAAALGRGLVAAKDLRVAQMLIEREARPLPARLSDESVNLKRLLKPA